MDFKDYLAFLDRKRYPHRYCYAECWGPGSNFDMHDGLQKYKLQLAEIRANFPNAQTLILCGAAPVDGIADAYLYAMTEIFPLVRISETYGRKIAYLTQYNFLAATEDLPKSYFYHGAAKVLTELGVPWNIITRIKFDLDFGIIANYFIKLNELAFDPDGPTVTVPFRPFEATDGIDSLALKMWYATGFEFDSVDELTADPKVRLLSVKDIFKSEYSISFKLDDLADLGLVSTEENFMSLHAMKEALKTLISQNKMKINKIDVTVQ